MYRCVDSLVCRLATLDEAEAFAQAVTNDESELLRCRGSSNKGVDDGDCSKDRVDLTGNEDVAANIPRGIRDFGAG